MPRSLQPLHKTQSRQLQHPTSRHTSRYLVVMLKIVLQGDHTPQEQLPLHAEENMDWSTEYRQVTSLMTLWTMILILLGIHTQNIVPLLALCPWRNSPHRGHEQQQPRQNNNTNVRTGHAPYSLPWDNQLYRRCTCSQQALHARAYCKIQRRYPIQ